MAKKKNDALFPLPNRRHSTSTKKQKTKKNEKQFSFDAVLGTDSTQEDVYEVSGEDEREGKEKRERSEERERAKEDEKEREEERRRDAFRPRPPSSLSLSQPFVSLSPLFRTGRGLRRRPRGPRRLQRHGARLRPDGLREDAHDAR